MSTLWKKICGSALAASLFFLPGQSTTAAQPPKATPTASWESIGPGLTGTLYGDPTSIQGFKRQGVVYWGILIKNDYKEPKYLKALQESTGHKDLTGSMSYYLFQPGNKIFTITNIFYINAKEEVLLKTTPAANVGYVTEDDDAKNILLYVIKAYKQQKSSK